MKRFLIGLGACCAIVLVAGNSSAQRGRGKGFGGQQSRGSGINEIQPRSGQQRGPGAGLLRTEQDATQLARLWEEEKLARDVYTKLAERWKLRVFQNISRAENQHMQAVARLGGSAQVNRIGQGQGNGWVDAPGVFAFPDYQRLYQSLVEAGSRSPLDALRVGAKIEEMDVADLRQILSGNLDPQMRQTMEQLRQGSHQHLRAFAAQIKSQGATYQAQYLSQTDFDAIANSAGRGRAMQGQGQGMQRRAMQGGSGGGAGRGAGNSGQGRGGRSR